MKTETLRSWSRRRVHLACLAAASAVSLVLASCGGGSSSSAVAPEIPTVIEAYIDALAAPQIGGATQAVALYNDGTEDWTLYSMANRFAVTKIGMSKDTVAEITVPGYIQHITVVKDYGPADPKKSYALLSMGSKGIAIVDISTPTAPALVRTMTVNYAPPEHTYSDGGGTVWTEPAALAPLTSGPVNDVLVHDSDGTAGASPGDQLFIANTAFGIQKTSLAQLMDAAADGVLPIEGNQLWTLKYAGENPYGGPLSLKMHGTGLNAKLYAALGFLGIGIYDPATLARTAAYNLYADCNYRGAGDKQEDWFGYPQRKIACPAADLNAATNIAPAYSVDGPLAGTPAVDADGTPTFVQAAFELKAKNDHTWYPWAEFDRYGKYYYNARGMELVDLPVAGGGTKTMAYIAYSLGGLVAVDVTDAGKLANLADPASVIKPTYAGYVPAAPAHGPDEPPINVEKKGILSHFGSGMLKEAGVMDVRVVPDAADSPNYKAYYTDHFAGLVVVSGAEDPKINWRNKGATSYNNNCIPDDSIPSVCKDEPRVFWPDYEFVTSYDMHPVVVGDESLPAFLVPGEDDSPNPGQYAAPMLLSTGEINGHGGALFLMKTMVTGAAGQVDAVQSSGAGGVSFVDFIELAQDSTTPVANRFAVPVNLVSTYEIGANEDGSRGQPIAIGHAEGVTVSGNHLYLADGPHGVSVWTIASGLTAIDDLHLVANTLQSEYPTPGSNVLPTPHAFKVAFGSDPTKAYVMSQSLGMRRVDVSAVTGGTASVVAPALLNAWGGVYEHNTEAGSVGTNKVTGQDHAYGVTFYGKYAIVADGDNGLTVYDTTAAGGTDASVVANIGDSEATGTNSGKPSLGRAATVKLWTNPATNKTYAVVAAGAYGISVVDMTAFLASGQAVDLTGKLIKTFEPLKSDDDNAFGSADGKSVDLHIVGDVAYFSYDSFGLGAYRMADLIAPPTAINLLCTDPTKLSAKQGGPAECRPPLAGYYKLQKDTSDPSFATMDGGALYMTSQLFPTVYRDGGGQVVNLDKPRLLFYVGYGAAGVVKLDWSDVANPKLMDIMGVVGGASATAINNGRVYVAAGTGGLAVLK